MRIKPELMSMANAGDAKAVVIWLIVLKVLLATLRILLVPKNSRESTFNLHTK